jgi:hypothetical protein
VRRSSTPSSRQYAGSFTGDGAPPRPAGGDEPSANHSAFAIDNGRPGICRPVSAAQAAASRLVWAEADGAHTLTSTMTPAATVIRMAGDSTRCRGKVPGRCSSAAATALKCCSSIQEDRCGRRRTKSLGRRIHQRRWRQRPRHPVERHASARAATGRASRPRFLRAKQAVELHDERVVDHAGEAPRARVALVVVDDEELAARPVLPSQARVGGHRVRELNWMRALANMRGVKV